jgi:endoglucanase
VTDADAFLSRYATADGRVLRRDQGNDIVSEGQAYGMLVAELAGRHDVVRSIWSWTRDHLRRPDGLLAYHADQSGNVLDDQAASDADTLAAFALLRYAGRDAPTLHAQGRDLADAVLRHETVRSSAGLRVLTAGPWATGAPPVVDPSYLMPSVFTDLAGLTDDHRWDALARTSVDLVDALTEHGRQLPTDWARLDGDHLVASGSGGGSGSPQYGPDAQRVPLWFGAACDARARGLAGAWWRVLQQDERSSATALGPKGDPIDTSPSTVALVAAAASARAAGDTGGAANLESGARQSDSGRPTYYGGAWLVLGPALWDGRLTSCP